MSERPRSSTTVSAGVRSSPSGSGSQPGAEQPSNDVEDDYVDLRNQEKVPYTRRDGSLGYFTLIRKIGEGGSSVVYAAEEVGAGLSQSIAVKLFKNLEGSANCCDNERGILEKIPCHTNVLTYLGYGKRGKRPFIVQELKAMDLGKLVLSERMREHLSFSDLLDCFIGISKGLKHLSDHGVVHFDLKPENVLLELNAGKYIPCVADFGLSRVRLRTSVTAAFKGTIGYIPYEVALAIMSGDNSAKVNGKKVDVFSFGKVMSTSVTGERPAFRPMNDNDDGDDVDPRRDIPDRLLELVRECENRDPENRPNWDDIINRLNCMRNSDWADQQVP